MEVKVSPEFKKVIERSYSPKNPYMFMELYALEWFEKHLTREAMKVLGQMLNDIGYDNIISSRQSDISRQLGISSQRVHRGVKELIANYVILEGRAIVGYSCYIFNPRFGWRGAIEDRMALVKKIDSVSYEDLEIDSDHK